MIFNQLRGSARRWGILRNDLIGNQRFGTTLRTSMVLHTGGLWLPTMTLLGEEEDQITSWMKVQDGFGPNRWVESRRDHPIDLVVFVGFPPQLPTRVGRFFIDTSSCLLRYARTAPPPPELAEMIFRIIRPELTISNSGSRARCGGLD